jgi:DNA repair protein RecO (recombination protein O)
LRALSRVADSARREESVLRRFELRLLRELGYAVQLTREAGTQAPIAAEKEYLYVVERGPVAATETATRAASRMPRPCHKPSTSCGC